MSLVVGDGGIAKRRSRSSQTAAATREGERIREGKRDNGSNGKTITISTDIANSRVMSACRSIFLRVGDIPDKHNDQTLLEIGQPQGSGLIARALSS